MILSVRKLTRVILTSIIFFAIISCSEVKQKEVDKTEDGTKKIDNRQFFIDLLLQDYNDATTLLHNKYEIDSTIASKITYSFIESYDNTLQELITGSNNKNNYYTQENLSDFIERMSFETGISKKTVSAYVMDLKLYTKEMESE